MYFIYCVLFCLALPFIFLRLFIRSFKAPAYRQRWAERLGYFKDPGLEAPIWIHAVSMGETIAALPIIKGLREIYPSQDIIVTTMTPTGSARVKAALGDSVYHVYAPYDTPGAVARFLKKVKPSLCLVMETELWPTICFACKKRKIPLFIANARLSEKSARGYQKVSWLIVKVLRCVTLIAVQTQIEANRFIKLGLPSDNIIVTGSIKFDIELPSGLIERAKKLRTEIGADRKIWIAASTHQGEDEVILEAHAKVKEKFSDLLLVLVPRHPERFDKVSELAKSSGFVVSRRSKGEKCNIETEVYVGDTMGELLLLFAATDICFVGGSFVPNGGHNYLEPAALSKPVLTGPSVFNFAEISRLLFDEKALFQANDARHLADIIVEFLENPTMAKESGDRALAVVEKNRGALAKHIDLATSLLPE